MKLTKSQLKEMIREIMTEVNESGILYKAGVKKYGKEGMKKIQSAAGKRKSHAEIGKIKDKYEKGKKEGKITETVPLGRMDRNKFMKYFDLVLKTAGSEKAEIYRILKKMMPSLDNRVLMYMAQGFEDAVTQMTGGGEE